MRPGEDNVLPWLSEKEKTMDYIFILSEAETEEKQGQKAEDICYGLD